MWYCCVIALLFAAVPTVEGHCRHPTLKHCKRSCSSTCPVIDIERCLRLCRKRCDMFCGNLRYPVQKLNQQEKTKLWESCGKQTNKNTFKIWNGLEADLGQFPWAVKIYRDDIHTCGGVLISKRHVLSSAHCFHKKDKDDRDDHEPPYPLDQYKVYIGGVDATNPAGLTNEIKTGRKNPGYTRRTVNGITDVYLFELKTPVDETLDAKWRNARPICLVDNSYSIGTEKIVFTYGWGITDSSGVPTNKLRFISLVTKDCQGADRVSDPICTAGDHTNAPCKGDSGGALQIKTSINGEQRWTLLGVLAKAVACPSSVAYPKSTFNGVQGILSWICDTSGVCKN